MTTNTLHVQRFAKKNFQPIFDEKNDPRLLYLADIPPHASVYPRIMHAHEDFVEIILIVSGESEYLIHNKQYTIHAGDLLVYNAGVVHDEVTGPDTEIGSYCIAIGGLRMPGLRENALIPDDAGFVFSTGEHFEEIRSLCSMMSQSLYTDSEGAEDFCNSLMRALIVRVLALVQGHPVQPVQEEMHELGHRIKEFIDQYYMEPITLQTIGDALNFSPYYLGHVFKEMSGYSPMQYLLRRRLGEAQTLLISTDLPIGYIAGAVGYETQSYFNLQFTKHVGMSPKRFRNNYVVSSLQFSSSRKQSRKQA
ncbi:MAG: AraC family transcriptional regulator [Butyricicoccus sp.]|nr:AraC family transcriptional regulator [Butyricicoccus sp.]MBQ8586096.1 AraC family transcriptional regulator [Butyricicoccus sp.]